MAVLWISTSKRWRRFVWMTLSASGLLFGAVSCGYSLGYHTPPSVHTIAVPIFNNDTFPLRREVEYELTSAFRKELQSRTALRLVSRESADWLVIGTIRQFNQRPISEGRRDRTIESNIYAVVQLVVEDRVEGTRRVEVVRKTEPFSIERGETFETGRRRAIANLAERMVTAIEFWGPEPGVAPASAEADADPDVLPADPTARESTARESTDGG